MKIRNKKTGAEYISDSLLNYKGNFLDIEQETYVYNFFKKDGWKKVKETDGWQPIERDKNGFALNNSLDKIFDKLPVEVLFEDKNNGDLSIELITDNCDIYGYRGDIERKTYYTHYRRIELPKK